MRQTAAGRTPSNPGTWLVACTLALALSGCRFDGKPNATAGTSPPTTTNPTTPPANTAPTIGGSPAVSAKVNEPYSFQPVAADADGDQLTFTIANKPAWANFSTSTGKLSGTPSSSYAGTFPDIVISVTDGQYSASLPAFAVTVKAAATVGSATLSWVPPKTNVDGTPVTNLAGFRIAYGQNSSNLTQSVTIASPSITSAAIENLSSGTWYFAVKAYTTTGVESDLSNLASKTI